MASNLKKRHQTWCVRVGVNPKHWDVVGRREIVRSLKTRDRHTAERLKHAAIAEIKADIDRMVSAAGLQKSDPKWLMNIAREIRAQVAGGNLDPDEAKDAMEHWRNLHHKAAGVRGDSTPASITASRYAIGENLLPLEDAIDQHLAAKERDIIASTYKHKQTSLNDFKTFVGNIAVTAVDRRMAGRYVSDVLAPNGRSNRSNKGTLSDLRVFFDWLIEKGEYEEVNPFSLHTNTFKGSRRGSAPSDYRAWTEGELKTLFKFLDKQKPGTLKAKAADVARISVNTGLRLNEICGMETEAVNLDEDFMTVASGKRPNSVRQVPIPAHLRPLIERLAEDSEDGYLISSLKAGGTDLKRGHSLGNRCSEIKRELFPNSDRTHAFHGLRATYITACEQAGVPEASTKLLVGHARQSLTYGLYSKGLDLDGLRDAAAKVPKLS